MKALRFHAFGSSGVLAIEEVPTPEPRAGEALVQVEAAGMNPSDVKNVFGAFKDTTLPRVPGRDFAGTVISGARYRGQSVWGSVPGFGIIWDGTHAEYVLVPDEALSIRPANLTAEQAAGTGVPFATAWGGLIRAGQLQAGETVLIVGAAGAVGQAATQIAKWKGARVLGAIRGEGSVAGAAAPIDTSRGDLSRRVLELTNGKGADMVFDTVGGSMFEPALRSLRRGGRQVAITSAGEPRVSFNLIDFYHNLSRLIGFDSYSFTMRESAGILDELRSGFEAGSLAAPLIETVPFTDAIQAYKDVADGIQRMKIVLTFSAG